jgi:hypothetical protein
MQVAMEDKNPRAKPYLSVMFECCAIYQRIYRHKSGRFYEGRCPRCLRTIRFRVAPGGTTARAFAVY